MYGDSPTPPTTRAMELSARSMHTHTLLEELKAREAMAAAAMPSRSHVLGWANLAPGSGLTEAQEDFVNYWAPQRVIDECQTSRKMISAVSEWAAATGAAGEQLFDRLLDDWVSGLAASGLTDRTTE